MHNLIRPALEKYLNDNGAAAICKTHLEPLTNALADAIEQGATQLSGTVTQIATRTEVGAEIAINESSQASGTIKILQTKDRSDLQKFQDGDSVQILISPLASREV